MLQQKDNNTITKQLFREISGGNRNAFDTLFRQQYVKLVSFAQSFVAEKGLAEEAVSDLFVWIWMNRASLSSVSNPEVYIFTAVKNRCLNSLRDASKIVSLDEYPETNISVADNPQTNMERDELSEKLNSVIENLPEQQRIIFRMIKENGLTAKQTAEILQLSPRTVETHIYKAIQQLEKEITEYLGYTPKKKVMKRMIMLLL